MEKILIVEDSSPFGSLLKKTLEKECDLPVVWVKSLKEAKIAIEIKNSVFAAAVLDLNLPDAPRGEIVDEINKHNIPSIVFTGNTIENTRDMVWDKGMADYIIKDDPNCLEYTVTAVRKLITNRNSMVLIVDNSPDNRKVFSELLYIQQYRVVTAENGAEALGILNSLPEIKLVITAYDMPEMNGAVLCQKIRQKYKKNDLAIIGTYSEKNINTAADFIKSGANDFLVSQSLFIEEFYCRVGKCIENIDFARGLKKIDD